MGRPSDTLEKAEPYYLGLYRLSSLAHALPHRTLILRNKNDLRRFYELCKKDYFDDYILFWPVTHDALRLLMAVRLALRQMAAGPGVPGVVPRGQESTRTVNATLLEAPGSSLPVKPQMIGPVPHGGGAVVGPAGGVQVRPAGGVPQLALSKVLKTGVPSAMTRLVKGLELVLV